jgi:hypothetical protein
MTHEDDGHAQTIHERGADRATVPRSAREAIGPDVRRGVESQS